MKKQIQFALPGGESVDLAGLSLKTTTWHELNYYHSVADSFIFDPLSEASLSEILDTAVREWLELQGAARIQNESDKQYVAECEMEDDARAAKAQQKVTKMRRRSA